MTTGSVMLVRQPPGSSLCGHACLAMILGIGLREAERRMGHSHKGTYTRELVEALGPRALDKRLVPLRGRGMPPFCVVRAGPIEKGPGHFVVYDAPIIFDPDLPRPIDVDLWRRIYWMNGWLPTSTLRLAR